MYVEVTYHSIIYFPDHQQDRAEKGENSTEPGKAADGPKTKLSERCCCSFNIRDDPVGKIRSLTLILLTFRLLSTDNENDHYCDRPSNTFELGCF